MTFRPSLLSLPLVVSLVAVLAPGARAQTTWYVDAANTCPGSGTATDPFCLIQTAIAAAKSGDKVLVAPGVYSESLDFLGKAITVQSTHGAAITILDGKSLTAPIVTFQNGEGPGSVLEGFTLANSKVGAILCVGTSPTVRSNVIRDNQADGGGAGIRILGQGSPKIENNEFLFNSAFLMSSPLPWGGGAIRALDTQMLVVTGNTFRGNKADSGGAILLFAPGSKLIAIDNEFIENEAQCCGAGGVGGAIYAKIVEATGNLFLRNKAPEDGGAIEASATVCHENTFEENQSLNNSGGAIKSGSCTLYDNVFRNNSSSCTGGAVSTSSIVAHRNTFEGNISSGGLQCGAGAAIYQLQGTAELVENVFINNVSMKGSARGAINLHTGKSNTAILLRNLFVGNAGGEDAAIVGDKIFAEGNLFQGNSGSFLGGAMLVDSAILVHNVFLQNVCQGDGGAVYSWSSTDPLVLEGNAFVGNAAQGNGGAVVSNSTALTVESCTFSSNLAVFGKGGGLYAPSALGPTTVVRNSIFWGNRGGGLSSSIVGVPSASVSFCDVENWSGCGSQGNLCVDPQLAADGIHLLPSSPCIDAGENPSSQLTDLEGDPRRVDGTCSLAARIDIGADEYAPTRLALVGSPQIGKTVTLEITNSVFGNVWLLASSTGPGDGGFVHPWFGTLLLDLHGFGIWAFGGFSPPGPASVAVPIPANPNLVGFTIHYQSLVVDTILACGALSNRVDLTVEE